VIVLDASAVLAFVYTEAGHETVFGHLETGHISAANWSEVLQKIKTNGGDPGRQSVLLAAMGLAVEPLTIEDAKVAASLYGATKQAGLSLGDRCCLALAVRLETSALTADKAWAGLDLPVEVELVR
jgi:ribonuclease VapC